MPRDVLPPVYLLAAKTVALGAARVLAPRGVPVIVVGYDPQRDFAQYSRHVAASVVAPHPDHHERAFVDTVIAQVARHGHGLLVPTSDEALVAVSRHKDELSRHATVGCPDWPVTEACVDKRHIHDLATAIDVPVPRTIVPDSLDDVRRYAARAAFPCLVKPTHSHLYLEQVGRKMTPVRSPSEMEAAYQLAHDLGLEVMLQEIIPGDDRQVFNYNAYADGGRALVEFTAQQLRSAPPWWGSPRAVRSRVIPEIIAPGRAMLRALGFSGFSCTEFKRDPRDGVFRMIEVNARHNLSTALASHCGMEFPWLEYRHRMFGDVPTVPGFRTGVAWIDLSRDIGYTLANLSREGLGARELLAPYRDPHVFAIWDRHDVRPFLGRLTSVARRRPLRRLAVGGGDSAGDVVGAPAIIDLTEGADVTGAADVADGSPA